MGEGHIQGETFASGDCKGSGLPHLAEVLFEVVSLQIFTRFFLLRGKQNKTKWAVWYNEKCKHFFYFIKLIIQADIYK